MFALPALAADIPQSIQTGSLAPAIARLGHTMIDAGMIDAADLRVGGAGPKRMIERVWTRWQAEDGLPTVNELPVGFDIADPHSQWARPLKKAAPNIAWLVLSNQARPTRWYVARECRKLIKAGRADLAEHALATLYAGLDAVCYAPKPPEFLAWARAFWWKNCDNEKLAGIKRRKPTGVQGLPDHGNPTRRRFDNRYPLICQAPRRQASSMDRAPRQWRKLAELITAVERAMRHRDLLRPNLHTFTGAPAFRFAAFVRWEHGDYLQRLVDTYFHHAEKHANIFCVHGAWPLATADDIARARRGIAANTRLASALAELCSELGWIARQSMGGHW